MTIDEQLRDIKKEFRSCMNGVLSAKMREAGMPYKVIFGVEYPRLVSIAQEFSPDRILAQTLWNENIRESKILAPCSCLSMSSCQKWLTYGWTRRP